VSQPAVGTDAFSITISLSSLDGLNVGTIRPGT